LVLAAWSGLGYNRRALNLRKTAQAVCEQYGGTIPSEPSVLRTLPGIGPYTANAIAVFAFNRHCAAIDTNIRRVLIHELKLSEDVDREELGKIALRLVPRGRARDWHNALMDYARLRIRKEASYIKPMPQQSRFEGSRRQIRGFIMRRLTRKRYVRIDSVAEEMGRSVADVRTAAESLESDGMVTLARRTIRSI
jgi:A/G-specific adenine glycosylase